MKIAVIGAGLMGGGLAHVFSKAGWDVAVYDPIPAALEQLPARVAGFNPERKPIRGTVRGSGVLAEAVGGADFVVEAAPEKPPLKQSIFVDLCKVCAPDTVIATNSSVIPVGVVTGKLGDADAARCIGTHFWNPPDLVPLVEVIQGPRTQLPAIDRAMDYLRQAGKHPVHVRRDEGFVEVARRSKVRVILRREL